MLLSIVALDDVWALFLFGIGVAVVTSLKCASGDISALLMVLREIGGAAILGILVGLPAAYLTGRIGVTYILCRAAGKFFGGMIGSHLSRADLVTKHWMGAALFPQAGVAIGMALVASNHFPEYRQILLSVIISSTVFFEIIGPVFTRLALKRAHVAQQ